MLIHTRLIRCAARPARKAMEAFVLKLDLNPPKAAVRRYTPGDAGVDRAARVNVYLKDKVGVWQLKISLTQELVLEKVRHDSARRIYGA